MMPGLRLNWSRTLLTTSCAAFPTAVMQSPLKYSTSVAPASPPRNTSGMAMSTESSLNPAISETSSRKAEKSRKHARLADPTENPFVMAFVVLPTASSESVMSRTLSGCSLISTMPPALSVIGPKTSMARTKTTVESMPIVATAVPKSPALAEPAKAAPPKAARPSLYESSSALPMMNAGAAVARMPTAIPAITLVPWPVTLA
mmetsp:Transcript_119328/g.337563  ORF Transcript_119328/g.337563 Transcript_119328/m.337563 type:complete len:203 (+) Transcript_119328:634-1242(+)